MRAGPEKGSALSYRDRSKGDAERNRNRSSEEIDAGFGEPVSAGCREPPADSSHMRQTTWTAIGCALQAI